MKYFKELLCLVLSVFVIGSSEGCDLTGGTIIGVPIAAPVVDVFRGAFFERETEGVLSLASFTTTSNTNYVTVTLEDSILRLSTTDAYAHFEEVEVDAIFGVTVNLNCGQGQTRNLIFQVNVVDTNNNDPIFLPNNEYEVTVTPPLPASYEITGCLTEIIVRDIDLTTSRIDFDFIDDNEYFQIEYEGRGDTKEFKAKLETKTFVRTLPQPLMLRLTATDVDSTGDPRRTAIGTIVIHSNEPFIPADLVFSETYYLGNYNIENSHDISLEKNIFLTQGYDEEVKFEVESDYEDYIGITTNGNSVALEVKQDLPADVIRIEDQIFLVIRAQRELVEDATATIILKLPEEPPLQFEKAHYEGTIEDNILNLPNLLLTQGYQDTDIAIRIENEHNSFFDYNLQGNTITITMTELPQNIIDDNNYLTLEIIASAGESTAITVVTLKIIKDDNITPVFEKPLYYGSYDIERGLNLEQIVIIQGYDSTVNATLEDDRGWFRLDQNGATLTLIALDIPSEVFMEQQLLLTIKANKPRTVTATTIVSIDLPPVRELGFEAWTYTGYLNDEQEIRHENISLSIGYNDDVKFTLSGDTSDYFTVTNSQNQVFISLQTRLPESVVLENNYLSLTIHAIGPHTTQANAALLIKIIKDDVTTPVFAQDIYYGNYLLDHSIEIDLISLRQGYDGTVNFSLEGETSEYFDIVPSGNDINLIVKSEIPEDIIFAKKFMVFSIFATKPLTVGGRATIQIQFPEELTNLAVMTFSQNTYVGIIEQNELYLEAITLDSGYNENVFFSLTGEYEPHFQLTNVYNLLNIALRENSTVDNFGHIPFIILEIEAFGNRAIPVSSSIVIEVKHEERVQPIFAKPYYTGVYNGEQFLFEEDIMLSQGYDSTVDFSLDEESSEWFNLVPNGESLTLTVNEIPIDILENNDYLIFSITAVKPYFETVRTAVIIDLPKEIKALAFNMRHYLGTLDKEGSLIMQDITLSSSDETVPTVTLILNGDLEEYFLASIENGAVSITLRNEIPEELLQSKNTIVLTLQASSHEYIPAYTTVIIEVKKEDVATIVNDLVFSELYYVGYYSNASGLNFSGYITLMEGYTEDVEFDLSGDDAQWFDFTPSGNSVTLRLKESIPENILLDNHQLIFFVTASKPGSVLARTTIVIALLTDTIVSKPLSFEQVYYSGTLNNNEILLPIIELSEGYTDEVTFVLFGELSRFFNVIQGPTVTIYINTEIEEEFPTNVNTIVLELQAATPENIRASATIILEIIKPPVLEFTTFEEVFYTGTYLNNELTFTKLITLSSGYNDDVKFELVGEQSIYFDLNVNGNSAQLVILNPIPPEIITTNDILIFSVRAQHPNSYEAFAAIIISLKEDYDDTIVLGFDKINYAGKLENNANVAMESITLVQGFSDSVRFELFGVMSDYFTVTQGSANPTITITTALPENYTSVNNVVILTLEATSPPFAPTYATVIIEIIKEETVEDRIYFSEVFYVGSYDTMEGLTFQNDITLVQGYDENVKFELEGDDSQWFSINQDGNAATIALNCELPLDAINRNQLIFVIEAKKEDIVDATATIIITIKTAGSNLLLRFEKINYLGTIEDNVLSIGTIVLEQGYSEDVVFSLNGDLSSYFDVSWAREVVTITLKESIPEQSIPANRLLVYDLMATAPDIYPGYATVIFEIVVNGNVPEIHFDKVLYEGRLIDGGLLHEDITLVGFSGEVEVLGDHASLFTATVSNNLVTVQTLGGVPTDLSIIVLELKASTTGAVLIVQNEQTETPTLPIVSFDSEVYALNVDVEHTGLLGKVTATASNSETVTYELILDNEHLQQRLSINNDGEIHLSARANPGFYRFEVQATTVISRVSSTAVAHLTVSTITVCANDDKVVPPLIIIDRDEESAHHSLVPLNTEEWPGCHYIMNNRWPLHQSWLYVDESGLHTTAIDREHPSIAFMALSQIQVELILQCNDDSNSRQKRSIRTESRNDLLYDWPYDYGSNKWILSDTIHFNSRRSFVNLIVNDINDNAPIFVGKENEPLAVGYPVSSLVDVILPRALAELEATDADIGENAVIRYWSAESVLAVSPSTGFVHVRVGEQVENDMRLIVQATDRFGDGLTGTIELLVKLVDSRHIAVVTVRDAFLDDEKNILDDLSKSVGYEVKALKSVITSDETQSDGEDDTRTKREVSDAGSSLLLYIYGLIEREPVAVEQLTEHITEISSGVNIVRTVSLEDHLVCDQICIVSTRETALLVATIVLSVLLFMLIAAIAFWFFLKWWRNRKYNEFTDESSLTSDKDTVVKPIKHEIPKPRLKIDELKRSERKLQEMLDLPVEGSNIEQVTAPIIEPTNDLLIGIPTTPISTVLSPTVIQSFDKLKDDDSDGDYDEFGEVKKPVRRKSVVTFNEHVEKIIHLEDEPSADSDSIEIYKF